jgi:hypothetical protein
LLIFDKFFMLTLTHHQFLLAGLVAQFLTLACFGQPATPAPVEFTKGQLETEQRIMRAQITDANFHVDRAIKSVGANLPDSAKVSLLRATGRVAQIDEVMRAHPERIERLAFSLFYSRETVRTELRTTYNKLRDEFGAVEDAMYALRRDMLRKGLFGDELKQQVAVLDAATKLLPEIENKNPKLAAEIRDLINQINEALARGDIAGAEKLIKQLNEKLEKAGYKQNVKDAMDKIGVGEPPAGTGARSGPLGGGTGGVTIAGPNGQTATIPFAVAGPGETATLQSGENVNLKGAKIQPDGSILLADGRVIKDGKLIGGNSSGGTGGTGSASATPGRGAVDAEGNEISDEYVWENGEGKGVDKTYVGGKGIRLTKETKVSVRATPVVGKANTYEVTKSPGESRTWAFVVAPVPGSEKRTNGSYNVAIALTDRSGAKGFTAGKWEITGPSGSPSLDTSSGAQVTATFSQSGTYSVQVSGTTDWGSPFVIKGSLKIGVD